MTTFIGSEAGSSAVAAQGLTCRLCGSGRLHSFVDRSDSPTYLNREFFHLNDGNQVTLYVRAGCAHGFQALTEPADVSYRIDRTHDPDEDVTIAHDDPALCIRWPIPISAMSERDKAAPPFSVARRRLSR